MLDLPRYLLGVAELLWFAAFATLGATALRSRLLPSFRGAPAHLATAVIALALLVWTAELLGSFGLLEPGIYVLVVGVIGGGLWLWGGGRWHPSRLLGFSPGESGVVRGRRWGEKQDAAAQKGRHRPPSRGQEPGTAGSGVDVATVVALAMAAIAVAKFGVDVRSKLSTGMTGFDSTWYHGPFAAGFFQSGDTWRLHFIAPQFLAWFYPANAELFHAAGMLAFGRDLLSPLLNLGWFVGCLVACWCIGRPYRVAPWSLALGAIALSLPLLSGQAGEARNDIVGIFFLLSAVAVVLNDRPSVVASVRTSGRIPTTSANGALIAGLAAGLAAGTKLNFLLPAAVLVLSLALIAPAGRRWRAFALAGFAALAGGGYWYLRNLIHAGNPLPWFDGLGPISLPAPEQALGGREGHDALSYLADGSVWSEWFLPGLHGGLTILWPPIAALALAGLLLCLFPSRGSFGAREAQKEPRDGGQGAGMGTALRVVGLTGLAVVAAWLIAPTSASGPAGMPRGFESGLRYLAPALALGLAVLPAALLPRVARWRGSPIGEGSRSESERMGDAAATGPAGRGAGPDRTRGLLVTGLALLAIAVGYPIQRHYLQNRYANPAFAAPGLNATFKWADDLSNARIATTSTRQYPLFGTDLSNRVRYVGEERPHGGFVAPSSCPQWRRLLNAGHYDYAVTSRDRIEPGKPPYPPTTRWTEAPGATLVLRKPPTAVFHLTTPLNPATCP